MSEPLSNSTSVSPRPPFAWGMILGSLRSSPGTVLERIDDDTYQRAVHVAGAPALLTVVGPASPEGPLSATLDGCHPEVVQRLVSHLFQTAVDTSALDAIDDPAFAQAWGACRGFRPVQLPSVWEATAWAIIGQQINVAFAARCKAAFCAAHGQQLETPSGTFTLFPTPEAIARLEEAALQALQFSRQKARYVIGVARAIVEGVLEPDALHAVTADEALDRLMALKGVGRWTAEYVLLRGLGHQDALPAGDVALQKAVGRAYGLGRLATEAEVRAYGQGWAPYRSYATIAFWRSNAAQRAGGPGASAP